MQNAVLEKRVKFDFEIDFSNGGGIQGQDFRLDIEGEDIDDQKLADLVVRDLQLLMVRHVRILDKQIICEPHKRSAARWFDTARERHCHLADLSHTVEDGMITYKGLPAPLICDFMSREASKRFYAAGTEFQIGKIEMVANTGTYLDTPFHRFEDGKDLSGLDLLSLVDLDAVVVRVEGMKSRAVDRDAFLPVDVRGRAVLVHTGWARNWGTD